MAPAVVRFSDLPTEALDEIARRVGPLDNFHCSAVCRSWRRALRATRLGGLDEPHRPHDIYMDIGRPGEPTVVEVRPIHHREGARSVKTVVSGPGRPDYNRLTIIGCSYGWVVADYVHHDTHYDRREICLIEPFTGRRYPLPPFTDSSRTYKQQEELRCELAFNDLGMFRKAAVAPGRRLGTYAVMLIHSGGQGLSFLKPGANSWRAVRTPKGKQYVDVVLHKGSFCTLTSFGEVNAWVQDGGGGMKTRRLTDQRPEQLVWAVLAESVSRDSLLMVSTMDKPLYMDYRKHYEVLCCDERERRWFPVKDLGETAILAGAQCSFCVSTRGGTPSSNYIYFASKCRSSSMGYDNRNPNSFRMPTATKSSTGGEIHGWTWFLPYAARLDPYSRDIIM